MGGVIIGLLALALYGAGIFLAGVCFLIYYLYKGIKRLIDKHMSNQESKSQISKIPVEPMAKVTEKEAFEDVILEVGYLRDYNYRFISVEDRAYELLSRYSDSDSFLDDVQRDSYERKDYVSEIIWFIASMIKGGLSSDQIDDQLRPYFVRPKSLENPKFIPEHLVMPEPCHHDKKDREAELARQRKEHYDQLKQRCEAIMAKGKTLVHSDERAELSEFKNTIYYVKFLGHEDPRFTTVALKAHDLVNVYGHSSSFYDDIVAALLNANDFTSEVIAYVIKQKKIGVSDVDLIRKLREKYLNRRDSAPVSTNKIHRDRNIGHYQVKYVEGELSEASKKLRAKAKIAHKHRAVQYANIIGGELAEAYKESTSSSFYDFVKEQCEWMAAKGDSSLTSEDFRSRNDVIVMYKKVRSHEKSVSVGSDQIVTHYVSEDQKVNSLLDVLNRLTSIKLPKYEIPRPPVDGDVYQREYKKTNPLEVYNDLVESEYGPHAFTDKRFSILYQLILFAAECLGAGMTIDETLAAISSMKVVRKRDLKLLREMAARYKGLSAQEKSMVREIEVLGELSLTNLYINLVRHYKTSRQPVKLNQYIISVILKQYKESNVGWSLLKYIYLKEQNKPQSFIEDNRYAITASLYSWNNESSLKDMNDSYYTIDDAFTKLNEEYNSCVGMTRYNLDREGLTPEWLKASTLNRYLPKRFDCNGRFCMLVAVSLNDAEFFAGLERMTVGDTTYLKFPIPAITTQDAYQLLLTCKKQMRMKAHKV